MITRRILEILILAGLFFIIANGNGFSRGFEESNTRNEATEVKSDRLVDLNSATKQDLFIYLIISEYRRRHRHLVFVL